MNQDMKKGADGLSNIAVSHINEDPTQISDVHMHRPTSRSRRRIYFIIFIMLFLALIPVVILFAYGYRLDGHFRLVDTGGISLSNVPDGSQVFINYKEVSSSAFFKNSFLIKDLLPDNYFVIVAKQGYWSWAKHIDVTDRHVANASVFVLPQETRLEAITSVISSVGQDSRGLSGNFTFFDASSTIDEHNPEYEVVASLFSVPSADHLNELDESGQKNEQNAVIKDNIEVWSNGRDIFSKWLGDPENIPIFFCTSGNDIARSISGMTTGSSTVVLGDRVCPTVIDDYAFSFSIKRLDFFPGRDDVVLVLSANGLYAVEMDRRPIQNLQPVYLAKNIDFRTSSDGKFIYIKESNPQGSAKAADFYQIEI